MKIRTKITGMGLLLVLLTAISIVGIAVYQENILKQNIGDEVDLLVSSEIKNVAQNVYLMCRTMQESLEQMLGHGLNVAVDISTRQGQLNFEGAPVAWEVVNQFNNDTIEVTLPRVLYEGIWLGRNTDFQRPTAIVDEVTDLQGVTCTVFQRMNEAGDMLRVATTVPDMKGNRAIGTYIPRRNPDGSSNPVIETLLNGEVFTGRAYVVNSWYLTGYQPLWDALHTKVIGALYVGQKQESVTSLQRGIRDIAIGKSGYVAVVGGKGEQQGSYIISGGGLRDCENLLQTDDVQQKIRMEKILQSAASLKAREGSEAIPVVMHRYEWQNPGP